MKHSYLSLLFLFGLILHSCHSAEKNNEYPIDSVSVPTVDNTDEITEAPSDSDTSIAVDSFPEFLKRKYSFDAVKDQVIHAEPVIKTDVLEDKTIKTTTIQIKDLNIEYTYIHFKSSDSTIVEIKVNNEKKTFVDENGKETSDFGDLDLTQGLDMYTISGEQYLLISGSPIDAQSWYSDIVYGLLVKVSGDKPVMLISTFSYPEDKYVTGDFYFKQDKSASKVYYLAISPSEFDDNGKLKKVFVTVEELNL
jgi:hypothetical protein